MQIHWFSLNARGTMQSDGNALIVDSRRQDDLKHLRTLQIKQENVRTFFVLLFGGLGILLYLNRVLDPLALTLLGTVFASLAWKLSRRPAVDARALKLISSTPGTAVAVHRVPVSRRRSGFQFQDGTIRPIYWELATHRLGAGTAQAVMYEEPADQIAFVVMESENGFCAFELGRSTGTQSHLPGNSPQLASESDKADPQR